MLDYGSRLWMRSAACLAVVLVAAGCRNHEAPASSPAATRIRCEMSFEAPPGYELLNTQEEDQGLTTGVHSFYSGPNGRGLVFTAGVLMDMLENPTAADHIRLTNNARASITSGGKGRWILFWSQPDACHQYTIGAEGFTLDAFLRLLRKTEIVSSEIVSR